MQTGILFLVLFLVTSAAHIFGEIAILHEKSYGPVVRFISKPLLMPLLGLYYVFAALPGFWSIWLVLGLLGGFFGDVCLMLPDRDQKRTAFKLGLLSFLLGHICYIIAFIAVAGNFQGFLWWAALSGLPFIVLGAILYPILTRDIGRLKIPVTIYIIAIALMGISTTLLWGVKNFAGVLISMIGAWFFMASDALNAYNRFVTHVENERVFTMATYILGQFFIVLGFLLL